MDAHGVTFVSVTQSLNTTTSMGRLTLNILISFAQSEREVIGERIRDKFAVSRARGMWMGGKVPLGYDVVARKLIVNEEEAPRVRRVFELFAETASGMETVARLREEGSTSKVGRPLDKGDVYKLLNNRTYVGEAAHKGNIYPGEHQGIVTRELWDHAHALIKISPRVRVNQNRAQTPALLKGLIFGVDGRALSPTHSRKNGRLYRYYVAQCVLKGDAAGDDILQSGGALEHYMRLPEEAGRAAVEAEGLRQRLATAERIESTKVELEIDRARLLKALQNDLNERQDVISEAILTFEELSNALYEKAGSLTISATPNGPTVDVRIDAQCSKGITKMQIFCFDLMLADLATRRGLGPGFLVHDSHLFDGVDERQVAKALQLGADHAASVGYQYIVTMNYDALPRDGFRPGFNVDAFVIQTELTDATETGGLFGLRFN